VSPVQAMERSYATLKRMLREGVFPPGTRLEANRIADQLGVSMTPVRDVLHRLVGERLVEASSGEGFHVPHFTEAALRELYEWNSALLLIAIRTGRGDHESDVGPAGLTPADQVAASFARIASRAPNREVRAAIESASDRLHPFRMIEDQVLDPVIGELDELVVRDQHQPQAIRRYHLRRMREVPALLRRRAGH